MQDGEILKDIGSHPEVEAKREGDHLVYSCKKCPASAMNLKALERIQCRAKTVRSGSIPRLKVSPLAV